MGEVLLDILMGIRSAHRRRFVVTRRLEAQGHSLWLFSIQMNVQRIAENGNPGGCVMYSRQPDGTVVQVL